MGLQSYQRQTINSYKRQAGWLLKEYVLADSFIPYTAIITGIFFCKMVYDLTQVMSAIYFKNYSSLSKMQRIEWNNRAMSTSHAIFVTIISLYFVFLSDLYSDNEFDGLVILRSSLLSTFALGVSVGYFLVDIGMIFWCYPALGGFEYVIHHMLSILAVAYAMLTGEGQLYTYMVLISEATTPAINLRWYLDTTGMKRSRAYVINGVVIFFTWLIARIILFVYLFYHLYLHFDQVKQLRSYGRLLVSVVPLVLTIMNLMWFGKIFKGLKKTLAKRQ